MTFRDRLSSYWNNIQFTLFPRLQSDIGELSKDHKTLAAILELIRLEEFIPCSRFNLGRPKQDRLQTARAFIAKIVFKIQYTKQLVERLKLDEQMRIICGWNSAASIPSEARFSRAFKEFAEINLPDRVHEALIRGVYKGQIVGQIVKDSTPIEAREKALKKASVKERQKLKNKKRTEKRRGKLNRRQRQLKAETLDEMLQELPVACDKGMKTSAQGYTMIWKGYKLHAALDDHCVPIAGVLTSASLHDCEAAIPLATKTKQRVDNFYDVMDAAYDHVEIREHSISLGHHPVIDKRPNSKKEKEEKNRQKKGSKLLNFKTAEEKRYAQRFPTERFNGLYKDFAGGRHIFYRGYLKISCHVLFGMLTVAAKTIIKLLE